ncbi:MAG: LicD family protein [Oscillospiraceae bacterium]|nr:LicD family protein [Oscillospiraceae bacterium]
MRETTPEEIFFRGDPLKELQHIQLELLIELDRICRKHDIPYCLNSGTLLGAQRHGGFIPWDDDIDVDMLRPDYERFCKVCEEELDQEQYFLQNFHTDPPYRWGYAKLLKNGTGLVRYHQEHLKQRQQVFIDIFPLDGVPAHKPGQLFQWFLALFLRKMGYSEIGKYYGKNAFTRMWYRFLNLFPSDLPNRGYLWMARRWPAGNRRELSSFTYAMRPFHYYTIDGRQAPEDILFEGVPVKAMPEPYRTNTLEALFGPDWGQLPPEESRIGHNTVSSYDFGEGRKP